MRTYILCETEEGESIDYYFQVNQVLSCEMEGASGQYTPVRLSKIGSSIPVIDIRFDAGNSTVIHEALHACIDFFRIVQKVNFDDLFKTTHPYGEEAFCHYHKQFCDAIFKALK
jgi:hypothetical protein